MFIVQPISGFGDMVCEELVSEEAGQQQWHTFEFSVAWFNYSGAERIKDSARMFLDRGGCIHGTVGLDFGSTTYEGLGSLLDLESEGASITTHVFCDENPACTFHPKVFLFSNPASALLFVGSNNMTGAGLSTNIEAALSFSGAPDDETILRARQTLASWRDDEHDSRIRRLTRELLEQLRDRRYVLTEDELRDRRNADGGARASQGGALFGRSSTPRQRSGRGAGGRRDDNEKTNGAALGEVLLMRVRPRRNGNQLQISMRVLEVLFMHGAEAVVSIDGSIKIIGYNKVRGKKNTARFEAPEMRGMRTPVARFRWINTGRLGRGGERILQYEIFDASSDAEGARILRKLKEGISRPPVTNLGKLSQHKTVLSKSDRVKAQWYRLDSP